MKVSAKAEYACLAVIALARRGQDSPPVPIREISGTYGIPERYLVQILLQLKGAGLVASTRGASGGYQLARSAARISLGEILSAIDGPDEAPRDGVNGKRSSAAVLAPVWESVRQAEREVLDRTMVAELAAGGGPHDWTI